MRLNQIWCFFFFSVLGIFWHICHPVRWFSDVWSLCVSVLKRNLVKPLSLCGTVQVKGEATLPAPTLFPVWLRAAVVQAAQVMCFSVCRFLFRFFPPMICSSASLFCQSPDSVMQSFCAVYWEAYSNEVCLKQASERTASDTFMQRSQVSNRNNSMKIHKCNNMSSYLWNLGENPVCCLPDCGSDTGVLQQLYLSVWIVKLFVKGLHVSFQMMCMCANIIWGS